MKPYEITYRILSSDTDKDRRLKTSRLFSLLQEAAIAHTEILGAGREKTLDRGLLWVISLEHVRIGRMPEYDDRIVLRSLPGHRMHTFFPRYYQIKHESGETIVLASALWILMDAKTRKMVQPSDAGIKIPGTNPDWETFLPELPPIPKNGKEHTFTVPYSYVDLNGHMNHTRFFDLAEDLMPEELRMRPLREICCEFTGEARQDDVLSLQSELTDDGFSLAGFRDKRLFRLSMQYE